MTSQRIDSNAEQASVTRARMMLVAVVVPLLLAAASALLIVSWQPTLPAQIAMHWGRDGVDGVGNVWELIAVLVGTIGLFAGVMAFSLGDVAESGRPKAVQKALAVTSLWLSVLLSVGISGSLAVQRGLTDAFDAPDPAPWLALGAILGLVLAAVAWFVLPKADNTPAHALDVSPIDVGQTERVFWTGTVQVSRGVGLIIAVAILVLAGSTISAALAGANAVFLVTLIVLVVVGLLFTTLRWRVSVSQNGASAVSFAGWPSMRIPLNDISAARLISVNPVGDFGGWGVRWGSGGRMGVIMQAGPALEVTRASGKVLVVPVDDAATAVAVLQAALDQRTNSN